jgi:hypothetical protein
MNFLHPTIEVVEACLTNKDHKAFEQINMYSQHYLSEIKIEMCNLSKWASSVHQISRFPALVTYIADVMAEIIEQYGKETSQRLNELVQMEEAYIWTDNKTFQTTMECKNQTANVRVMLCTYFEIIIGHLQHFIPKAIMHGFVRKIQDTLSEQLLTRLDSKAVKLLLIENPGQCKIRDDINTKFDRILAAKVTLKEYC